MVKRNTGKRFFPPWTKSLGFHHPRPSEKDTHIDELEKKIDALEKELSSLKEQVSNNR